MLDNQGQASVPVTLIYPVNAANTAAATSGWIDVRGYEGDLVFTQHVGAMTGAIVGTIEDATTITGTLNTAIIPTEGAFTIVLASNSLQKRTINAKATRGFVRYIGTITTGPAQVAVNMTATPKYTT